MAKTKSDLKLIYPLINIPQLPSEINSLIRKFNNKATCQLRHKTLAKEMNTKGLEKRRLFICIGLMDNTDNCFQCIKNSIILRNQYKNSYVYYLLPPP